MPGVVYGPGPASEGNLIGRLIRDHLAGTLPGVIGAARRWSFAYIDDVAEAHVRAITSGQVGQTYPLGGENAPQMRIFEIVRERTGRPLPRRIPYAAAWAAALIDEARARMTGRTPLLTRGVVEIFRHDWSMDSARSLAELNYRVSPLDRGISALLSEEFPGPNFAARE